MTLTVVRIAGNNSGGGTPLPPIGTYWPDASTSGHERLIDVSQLTTYTGGQSINTPGQTFDSMLFDKFVDVVAADVTFNKCRFIGPAAGATGIRGLVNCMSQSCVRANFNDCTFAAQTPNSYVNGGVMGHDFTANRCHAYWTVDGFGIYNTGGPNANAVVKGCYIHDLSYFAPDVASNRPETHNDDIQIQGGDNITIFGNNLEGYMTTDPTKGHQTYDQVARGNCIMLATAVSTYPIKNFTVKNNRFHGGGNGAQFTCRAPSTAPYKATVMNNQFDTSGYNYVGYPGSKYQLRANVSTIFSSVADVETNYWGDTTGNHNIGDHIIYATGNDSVDKFNGMRLDAG